MYNIESQSCKAPGYCWHHCIPPEFWTSFSSYYRTRTVPCRHVRLSLVLRAERDTSLCAYLHGRLPGWRSSCRARNGARLDIRWPARRTAGFWHCDNCWPRPTLHLHARNGILPEKANGDPSQIRGRGPRKADRETLLVRCNTNYNHYRLHSPPHSQHLRAGSSSYTTQPLEHRHLGATRP
ncbi:hypothetical protein Hbut_0604 [Hyperthermus butylicus DSM 5456]|uniref:Uncharacterized protein n=1 Tax=Hyperthermus butylicus (strain DSM 5456 / JCM 9403 / PLM1-5) TaxID=415426 RepID=A2BKF2_HYPBU|nr:hypothetical protein Hbut_0604 [Hyperthermus butylicus DSM 5456]